MIKGPYRVSDSYVAGSGHTPRLWFRNKYDATLFRMYSGLECHTLKVVKLTSSTR